MKSVPCEKNARNRFRGGAEVNLRRIFLEIFPKNHETRGLHLAVNEEGFWNEHPGWKSEGRVAHD
jgi:hypothetical protein